MMHLTWILLIFTSLYIWCQEKFGGQKVERLVQLTGQAPARILERQNVLQTSQVLFRRICVSLAMVLPFKDSESGT